MKRKLMAVLAAAALTVGIVTACGTNSADDTTKEGYVTAKETVEAAKKGDTHILDVREWSNYVEGRVSNSEWCPIFPLEDESLADNMTEYAQKHLQDDKDIYIVCNSGQRGAEKAIKVLEEAGIPSDRLFTVEGGAKALGKVRGALTTERSEENIDWQYISGAEAVKAIGDDSIQLLDVRDDDTYTQGHLEGSLQCNLKEIEDPDAQTSMYEMAMEELDPEKPIYIICYSGNKCAKTAISVMKDAGYDTDNIFIIENGAKDSDVSSAFVTK